MKNLLDYFEIDEILELANINPDIKELDEENVDELVKILKDVDCDARSIKEIIYANPFYLNRLSSDVEKLVTKLKGLGVTNLSEVFTGNPWLLDRDVFEIDEFLEEKGNVSSSLDDINQSVFLESFF